MLFRAELRGVDHLNFDYSQNTEKTDALAELGTGIGLVHTENLAPRSGADPQPLRLRHSRIQSD